LRGEEILAQVQNAAQQAKQRVNAKKNARKMGFLRQSKDGSTTLNLLIKEENEGPERVVTIGDLVGKLQTGSTQLQVRQADKRNAMKTVKPLSYGAFASFAPTFDSRFSTLSAEETQLVLRTYGDASSAEYAESILQFTKDSSYGTTIANGLLDILTNGEHSKSLDELYNMQLHSYEQREISKCFEQEEETPCPQETAEQIEQEYEKYKNTAVDFKRLQSLGDLGIYPLLGLLRGILNLGQNLLPRQIVYIRLEVSFWRILQTPHTLALLLLQLGRSGWLLRSC